MYLSKGNLGDIIDSAKCIISTALNEDRTADHLLERITQLIRDSSIYDDFFIFVQQQTEVLETVYLL